MPVYYKFFISMMSCLVLVLIPAMAIADQTARGLIKAAIDHYRGLTSVSQATMTIHRTDWQRSMEMKAWTSGTDQSLVRITAPKKDAGNGTLLLGEKMWSYNPKINRVIRIPASLAGQSWMGSDFSNNDIARADDLIDEYDHRLLGQEQQQGHIVYQIESIPHDDAPVVWGKEVIKVRDDYVLIEHAFYDQQGELIKVLKTRAIKQLGGRQVATIQRMQKIEQADEWTEFELLDIEFDVPIPSSVFTLSNLRNPRE